jgi:hypothetical protein
MCYYEPLPCRLGELQRYRCMRGSSQLEGYHKHLRLRMEGLVAATPEYKDAIQNEFDLRVAIRAGRRVGLDKTGVLHSDVALMELYHDRRRAVFGNTGGLKGYTPLRDREPTIRHGIHFSQLAWSERCVKEREERGIQSHEGLSLHDEPTTEDVSALLEYAVAQGQGGQVVTGEGLSKLALSRGLIFTETVADTWLRKQRDRENVLYQMHDAGYSQLATRLRPARGTDEQRAHTVAEREGLDLPDAEAPLQGPSISHDNGRVNVARAEHGAVVTNSGDSDGDGDSGSDSGSDDDGWDSGGDDSDMRQRGPVIAEATAVVVSSRTGRRKGSGGGVGGGGKRQRVAPGNVNDRGRSGRAPRPNVALREQTESGEEKVARNAKLALASKRYRCRNCKPRNPCANHLV